MHTRKCCTMHSKVHDNKQKRLIHNWTGCIYAKTMFKQTMLLIPLTVWTTMQYADSIYMQCGHALWISVYTKELQHGVLHFKLERKNKIFVLGSFRLNPKCYILCVCLVVYFSWKGYYVLCRFFNIVFLGHYCFFFWPHFLFCFL